MRRDDIINKETAQLRERFELRCLRCGSADVEVTIEQPKRYSRFEVEPATLAIKCRCCPNGFETYP